MKIYINLFIQTFKYTHRPQPQMKHTLFITISLIIFFFFTQLIGLAVINQYISPEIVDDKVTFTELPFDIERPPIEESFSFIYILFAVLIATAAILIIIKWKKLKLWKAWYLLAVIACMTFAFFNTFGQTLAVTLAIILGVWKVFKPNVIIHNLTEVAIYPGLAAIFVPIMNIFAAIALLLLISVYDIYAVNKSKHMVSIANFQSEAKTFAGLNIPYKLGSLKKPKGPTKTVQVKHAVLGGGDIGFPLIFAGVVMKTLLPTSPNLAFISAVIIAIGATAALAYLLLSAKKDKFYPAMPYITAGCLIGYSITLLL